MYSLYVDESGTPELGRHGTDHFVLAGLSIPMEKWKQCEKDIAAIKKKYDFPNDEIHIAWMLKKYPEQNRINNFNSLDYKTRRYEVERLRTAQIHAFTGTHKALGNLKNDFAKSNPYIHLTFDQRKDVAIEIATTISEWSFARLFAECIDKNFWNPSLATQSVSEQAFEQVISRFQTYLSRTNSAQKQAYIKSGRRFLPIAPRRIVGFIIHDQNQTIAKKHTELMKSFHDRGTLWTNISNIVETPFFVDSTLTSMIQTADVCSYALRRYLEKGEEELFDLIFLRADRRRRFTVGVRHYSRSSCSCAICQSHSW
ncbi:MAG TPA: DUF3800 domain-containing protein [Candidatus Kapabacteria bacterium]|nr:DUF3800 domain-containing protein [Candidatus Kapabacteria bacterium]